MEYQARKAFVRLAQVLSLSILFFSLPAWAQFEVAPDHFEPTPSPVKKQTAKTTAGQSTQLAASANVGGKQSSTGNSQPAASALRRETAGGTQARGNGSPQLAKTSTRKTTARKRVTTDKVALASTR
jgi:hypothetical protein